MSAYKEIMASECVFRKINCLWLEKAAFCDVILPINLMYQSHMQIIKTSVCSP